MKATIVIDKADRDLLGEAIATIRKAASVVACCDGDAMEERDALLKGEEAYNAVITYMLGAGRMEEPMEFLRCWNEGDFDSLRKEWPDAPPEIYYADPLNKQ